MIHKRLFPLRIYTALKLDTVTHTKDASLFPLRIYTALKLSRENFIAITCLFPLRIYTALKHTAGSPFHFGVCFPYEFTLLSNCDRLYQAADLVCFPYEFTLLSNLKPQIAREKYLRNICVTSLVFFGNTFILT